MSQDWSAKASGDQEAFPRTWERLKREFLEAVSILPDGADQRLRTAEFYAEAPQMQLKFLEDAIRRGQESGLDPETSEAWELLDHANDIALGLRLPFESPFPLSESDVESCEPRDIRQRLTLTYSHSEASLFKEAKAGNQLEVDRSAFESGVAAYLQSDYRIPAVDRLILTGLLDMEITSFLKKIMWETEFDPRSRYELAGGGKSRFVEWLKVQGGAILVSAWLLLAIHVALGSAWISSQTAYSLRIGVGGVYLLAAALPILGSALMATVGEKYRTSMVLLPEEMRAFYGELHIGPPLSVRRIRAEAERIAGIGAAWPGAIWALLDDIEARGVVSLNE